VDCDLRRPRLHRLSRAPRDPGLVEVLLGSYTPSEVVRPLTDNLWLLAAGATPPNPPALLGSSHMRDLVRQLAEEYDVVVLDCPPALLGADAALVGTLSDGVLFVVRAGRTDKALAQDALRQLRHVGVRLLGAALNDPDATMPQYSYDSNETYKEYYYEQAMLSARPAKSN
jgi:capsular exopolysaccharide synthesis family protein